MAKNIIIDSDPGVDDIIAILFAHKLPDLNIEGVTTVAGNVGVEQGTQNALRVLSYIGADDIPVAKGFNKPLVKEYHKATEVHGGNGMAGVKLPKADKEPVDQHAVDFIIKKAKELGKVTLVPVGPLTNTAIALRKEPGIKENIDKIYLMGGAFRTKGNSAPLSEFNVYTDPEAARMVFQSDIPIAVGPLDATMRVPMKEPMIEDLKEGKTPEAKLAYKILKRHYKQMLKKFDTEPHMHDALAVYMTTGSQLVSYEKGPVSVETKGELTYGETVGDFRGRAPWRGVVGQHPSSEEVEVAMDVDKGEFYGVMIETLKS